MNKRSTIVGFAAIIVLMSAAAAQGLAGENTVDSGDIIDGSIKHGDIKENTIGSSRMLDNSVHSVKISDSSIVAADMADGAVRSAKLGTITQRSELSATILGGGNGQATANCLSNEKMISGGNDGSFDVFVVASRAEGNGWRVLVHNNGAEERTITAHVYCLAS